MIKTKKYNKKGFWGLLWLAPGLILILMFSYYPLFSAFYYSLTDWNGKLASFIGFANFTELFSDTIFLNSIKTTLILTCSGILIGNVATLILAECLFNLKGLKLGSVYRFLFVLPCLVPGIVNVTLPSSLKDICSICSSPLSIIEVSAYPSSGWTVTIAFIPGITADAPERV